MALGACAAPLVFEMTPAPFSGDAMGAAFARFDQIALGAAVVLLGAEVARTCASGAAGGSASPPASADSLAVLMAGCAAYSGLSLPRASSSSTARAPSARWARLGRSRAHAQDPPRP